MKSIWRKMVHFGTYWSILEKRTKVNAEVKPEGTTIEDMHNLPSPLGEPKPIRRASFEIFLEGTSNSKWRQDLQVSPILFVSLPKHQKSDPWSPIHVLVVSTHHLSSRHPSKGVPTQLWTIRSFSLNPNPPLSIIYMP